VNAFPLPPAVFGGASRRVGAGNLFDWLRQDWAMFRAAPLRWLGMGSLFLSGILLSVWIFAVWGALADAALLSMILTPLSAAMLCACARFPHPAYRLFLDAPRLVLPVAFLGGLAFLVFLSLGMMPDALARIFSGDAPAASSGNPARLSMMMLSPLFFLFAFLLFQAASVIGLFALLLIMLHAMPIGAALAASLTAYQKNFFCLTLFAPLLAGILFFGLCTLGLGFVISFPVLPAALHAAYRDIFAGI
jgi:uncharacterized membrane protein